MASRCLFFCGARLPWTCSTHAWDAWAPTMLGRGLRTPCACMVCQLLGERLRRAWWERMWAASLRPSGSLPSPGVVRRGPVAAVGAPPAERQVFSFEDRVATLRREVEDADEDAVSRCACSSLDDTSGLFQARERAGSLPPSEVTPSPAGSCADASCPSTATRVPPLSWEALGADAAVIPAYPDFAAAFRAYSGRVRRAYALSRVAKRSHGLPWLTLSPWGLLGAPPWTMWWRPWSCPIRVLSVGSPGSRLAHFGPVMTCWCRPSASWRPWREC